MSKHHVNLVRTIFNDPPSRNVHWRDIESLLKHVGAEIENLSGARIKVHLNKREGILHRPHHGNTLDASSLLHVRELLARGGVTPALYEEAEGHKDA